MNRSLVAFAVVLIAGLALFVSFRYSKPAPSTAPPPEAPTTRLDDLEVTPAGEDTPRHPATSPDDRVQAPGSSTPLPSPELLVTIVDTAGAQLAGVCVRVQRAGGFEAGGGVTATEGPCRIPLDELGMYAVDTTMGNQLVQVDERRPYAVEIVAGTLTTVNGRVVDADGASAPGATILIATDDSCLGMQPVATAGDGGAFTVRIGKAWCFLSARKAGHVDGPVEQAKDGVTLTLGTPSSRCVLRTVDTNGAPLDCWVFAGRPFAIRIHVSRYAGDLRQQLWPPGRELRTGTRGEIELEGIGASHSDLTVVPVDPRWGHWQGTWQGLQTQTVVLQPSCTVEGRVLDSAGRGVAGATVRIGEERQWRPLVSQSGSEGRFSIHGVGTGRQHLHAHGDGGSADARIDGVGGGRCFVTLVLGSKHRVQLVDADGNARAGVVVRLSSSADSTLSLTDDDGEVTAPQSWWRDLVVEVLAEGGAWRATDAVAGGATQLTVKERGGP